MEEVGHELGVGFEGDEVDVTACGVGGVCGCVG